MAARVLTATVALVLATACGDDSAVGPTLAETTTTTAPTTAPDSQDEDTGTTTTTSELAPRQPAEFTVGDRVESAAGNFLQVYTYEQPVAAPEFWDPDPGNEFAVADIEACAGPTDDDEGFRAIDPFDFELHMPDNTRRYADISVREPALNYTELPYADDCIRGWVSFEVPVDETPQYIEHVYSDPTVRWTIP
jgi:hypothetical protein